MELQKLKEGEVAVSDFLKELDTLKNFLEEVFYNQKVNWIGEIHLAIHLSLRDLSVNQNVFK